MAPGLETGPLPGGVARLKVAVFAEPIKGFSPAGPPTELDIMRESYAVAPETVGCEPKALPHFRQESASGTFSAWQKGQSIGF
jgi:hypothetical protein